MRERGEGMLEIKVPVKCLKCDGELFESIFTAEHYQKKDGVLTLSTDGIILHGKYLKCVNCGNVFCPSEK